MADRPKVTLRRSGSAPIFQIEGMGHHVWLAIIIFYSTLLPKEVGFDIAGAAIYPFRLALLALAPFAIRELAAARLKPSIVDALVVFVAIWFYVSLLQTTNSDRAMIVATANSIDYVLAYLIGRVAIRNQRDFRALITAITPGLIFVAAVLMAESISHRTILRPILAALTNQPQPLLVSETRLGLMRATGPFPHPIIGGVFMASLLPVAWFSLKERKVRNLAVLGTFGAIFTVSATSYTGLILAVLLIGFRELEVRFRFPVFVTLAIFAAIVAVGINLVSESGLLSFLGRNLVLDSGSWYYRKLIWTFGSRSVEAHPWFGIGLADWVRPTWMPNSSVDSQWLATSMVYGLPLGIGSLLVVAISSFKAFLAAFRFPVSEGNMASGMSFSLFVFLFTGFTITIWENPAVWMLMLCGIAVTYSSIRWKAVPPAPHRHTRRAFRHHGRRSHGRSGIAV